MRVGHGLTDFDEQLQALFDGAIAGPLVNWLGIPEEVHHEVWLPLKGYAGINEADDVLALQIGEDLALVPEPEFEIAGAYGTPQEFQGAELADVAIHALGEIYDAEAALAECTEELPTPDDLPNAGVRRGLIRQHRVVK